MKGVVNLRIKPKWERFNWIKGERVKVSKEMELQFPVSELYYETEKFNYFNLSFKNANWYEEKME